MASVPGILVVTHSADRAEATVCVGGGRRISVSGCTDIGDTIARYVPPPAAYAPLPEDSTPPPPAATAIAPGPGTAHAGQRPSPPFA